jgi:thiamine-monophosphate kinase
MMAQASGLSIRLTPGLDPEALRGGEDYARCFGTALPRETLEARLGRPLIEVGVAIPRGPGPIVLYDGGEDRPLADLSFDHFTPGS